MTKGELGNPVDLGHDQETALQSQQANSFALQGNGFDEVGSIPNLDL
ncbi:hypothetical protein [Acanthopleuribacter pedis]|uniref:Uncharacterized protein n=1 Tax=Acanthopleuribacter pedis TaxID=442870 RepID=A0A8J7QMJ8_9BACT|nr:hypothetical protein [Acanthopleuribacter pedis]MBO1321143.1 hypothetical protein [Acanthopleuribacter pedis]